VNVKVADLMTKRVVTTERHVTIDHVRHMLANNKIGAIPVVDGDGHPVGIVSTTDLVASLKGGAPVSSMMTDKVYTVSEYDDVSIAARLMRNHKIHRVVVTREKKVVGIISSFDLLRLVEDHRFVAKAAPTPKGKAKAKA